MKFMMGSGVLCLVCYIVASLSEIPLIGLIGCIMCGFSVGIMWPGTIYRTFFGEKPDMTMPCYVFKGYSCNCFVTI